MSDKPTHVVNTYGIDPEKTALLDRDTTIPLTEDIANGFLKEVNAALAQPQTHVVLTPDKAEAFAKSITHNRHFPFTATVQDGAVVLQIAFNKISRPLVLKDLSDGFTAVFKDLVRSEQVSEGFKLSLTRRVQPALYNAYGAAGMPEGPHTKYTLRSC